MPKDYDKFLNKKEDIDLSDGVTLSNVQEAIKNRTIGLNQTKIDTLFPNEYIQSKNYIADTSGWRINGDGTAQFNSGVGNVAAGNGTRTSATGTGTVDVSCGFEPKLIKIHAYCDLPGGWTGWSVGHATGATGEAYMAYSRTGGGVWEKQGGGTYIIYVKNDGQTASTIADISAVDSDGFTINFSTMGVNVFYMWEAWG